MIERDETIQSGGLNLEGRLALPAGAGRYPGVVVCHPHPQYGGDMNNNVVQVVCTALQALEIASLRFNFRGVGRSVGVYDDGHGEAEDATAAVKHLAALPEIEPAWVGLAGYSFGAGMVLLAAAGVRALCLVSPPVRMVAPDRLAAFPGDVLIVSGDADHVAPGEALAGLVGGEHANIQVQTVRGADHFWSGYERELAEAIIPFFERALKHGRAG